MSKDNLAFSGAFNSGTESIQFIQFLIQFFVTICYLLEHNFHKSVNTYFYRLAREERQENKDCKNQKTIDDPNAIKVTDVMKNQQKEILSNR